VEYIIVAFILILNAFLKDRPILDLSILVLFNDVFPNNIFKVALNFMVILKGYIEMMSS
jgi:hypothetical protein